MRQRKRKLLTIALLALALLVGGTFAYNSFNQQVINDRANDFRSTVPGRIHDYYNRDTGNKDVFAENYGHDAERAEPIMVRIRLSEYMDTQRQGEDDFTPIVENTEREDITTWTPYRTEERNINVRTGDSLAFDDYIRLTFGWQRGGQDAPWYMPTFNHELESLKTAAAGHARDYIKGGGATDGETEGATHPGDGTDAFWTESGARSSYNNSTGTWPGAAIIQETKQHLVQERPPMTLWEWERLPVNQRFGNFWVLDHNTGWAYWAELLEAEQATSYLLDEAVVREEVVRKSFVNGSYYYAIHVDSQVISSLDADRFLEEDAQGSHDNRLRDFLEVVAGDGNPRWNRDSEPSDFNFEIMRPGRIFTMAGEEYRYLASYRDTGMSGLGNGNHMIIRNRRFSFLSWNDQEAALTNWFDSLSQELREEYVVPVASSPTGTSFTTGIGSFTRGTGHWLITNLATNQAVANDRTVFSPNGVRRAFALSLADVQHLSSTGSIGFNLPAIDRSSVDDEGRTGGWWLRTPEGPTTAWFIGSVGPLYWTTRTFDEVNRGVRPALIIRQKGD